MPFRFETQTVTAAPFSQAELIALDAVYGEAFPSKHTFVADLSTLAPTEMQALNLKQRQVDQVTDVLSFPLFSSFSKAETSFSEATEVAIGSIIICPEYAHSVGTPLIELVHHGLLHLLGYDHETDRKSWETVEKKVCHIAARHGLCLDGKERIAHDHI